MKCVEIKTPMLTPINKSVDSMTTMVAMKGTNYLLPKLSMLR